MNFGSKSHPSFSGRAVAGIVLVSAAPLVGLPSETSACCHRRARSCAWSVYAYPVAYSQPGYAYQAGYGYQLGYAPAPMPSPQSNVPSDQMTQPSQPVQTQEELDKKQQQQAENMQRAVEEALQQQ
jgi:hypothetical protein